MISDFNVKTICFAHPAYQMQAAFTARNTGIDSFQVHSQDELLARGKEGDIIVASGLWRNELLGQCPKLRYVQSISAGVDQFDQPAFAAHGVRLASAQGGNANAVSDHAMALILAMYRLLPQARDNQMKQYWRPMISTIGEREDELTGKTLLLIGLGRIGGRVAKLAKAFGMKVIALRRDPESGSGMADEVYGLAALKTQLPRADIVVLTCALTPETTFIMNEEAFTAMKPTARLVNVARGRVVNETALIEALKTGAIAGAALDTVVEEPLPASSPLWKLPNVFITPHSAGETRLYEENVVDILLENIARLQRGETALLNQIV